MLTILASFAQEEVRSISDNVKWGLRKRFKNGTAGRCNKHLFGLQYNDETKQYEIIPEEAEIVRLMFKRYLEQVPLHIICDEIYSMGYRGTNGGAFQEGSLLNLLHNEIYAGDILFQKAYVTDPITKKKVKNCGELPQYYLENAHECCPYVSTMHTPKKPENRAFLGDLRMHTPVISIENVKTAPCLHERVCKSGAVFCFVHMVEHQIYRT